jgi:hypothetical protein
MRDFAKSSGNAANVLRTLEVDAAISVARGECERRVAVFRRRRN